MKIFNLLFFFVIFISENHGKVNNAELYDKFMYETNVLAKGACDSSDFSLSYYDRKDKLKQILEEFNTFMAQKALIEDSPYKFPGEDLLRMINFEPLADKKTNIIIIKMMDEKNKINYYWTALNKNTVRKIAPGTLTKLGCDSEKIFDWEANVNSEFTFDVNKIYKEFMITVGELMQDYQNEMELCDKIPIIKTTLIDFTTQLMKSHFQRYVIDVFNARVYTFCRKRCITFELRAINQRFIKNLDGLEELVALMISDWYKFQEKCLLKSTTTTTTTTSTTVAPITITSITTTSAPIIIPPYHQFRPHPSNNDNCWGTFDWFKHNKLL